MDTIDLELAVNRATGAAPPSDTPAPPVREFPEMAPEAYIGLAGDIVKTVAPHTESDPTGLLLSAHVFFGNCIGRGPHYRVEATKHGPNLYVVKVGDSSKARKGTGEDRIRQFFGHVDDTWANQRIHTGLSSGEGVIWAVRDPLFHKVKDKKTGSMTEELVDAGIDDKRLLIVEGEFAGALRVMTREGNILSRVLRDGWDSGSLATLTKNSPARATGACLSMVGHITTSELRATLDRVEMSNGFANRILFCCVRRARILPFGGSLDERDVIAIAHRIRHAVEAAKRIGQVTMDPEAAEAWRGIYPALSADCPGLLGSLTARAEAQVVRLAMLYALWDESNRITLEHLLAAVAVQQFCRASVEYIFADMLGDPVADTILDALRAAGSAGLNRTEISGLFARHQSASQISRALGELARRGLAGQRRRPAEIWVATMPGDAA